MPPASFFTARRELLLSLPLLAIFAAAIVLIWPYPVTARLFPLTVSATMIVVALYRIAIDASGRSGGRSEQSDTPNEAGEVASTSTAGSPQALVWFGIFFVALWALGFLVAVPLYTFVYLRFASRERLWVSAAGAVVAWLFLYLLFVQLVPVPLLEGVLLEALGLS